MSAARVRLYALAALVTLAAFTWSSDAASSCLRDRRTAPRPGPSRPLAAVVQHVLPALVLLLLPRPFPPRRALVWPLSVLFFNATYQWLAVLREAQGDSACGSVRSRHYNGISGHAAYYLFFTLVLYRAASGAASALGAPAAARDRRVLAVWAAYAALSVWIVSSSLLRGYHSLRQVVLGAAAGLIMEAAFWAALERAHRSRAAGLAACAALAAAFAGGAVTLQFWQHVPQPLPPLDLAMTAVALAACVAICASPVQSTAQGQQQQKRKKSE